jgi:hypothetical protein
MMCSPAKETMSQTVRMTSMEADSVRRTRFAVQHLENRTSHLPVGRLPVLCILSTRLAEIWSSTSFHMPMSVITAPPEPAPPSTAHRVTQIFTVNIPNGKSNRG